MPYLGPWDTQVPPVPDSHSKTAGVLLPFRHRAGAPLPVPHRAGGPDSFLAGSLSISIFAQWFHELEFISTPRLKLDLFVNIII